MTALPKRQRIDSKKRKYLKERSKKKKERSKKKKERSKKKKGGSATKLKSMEGRFQKWEGEDRGVSALDSMMKHSTNEDIHEVKLLHLLLKINDPQLLNSDLYKKSVQHVASFLYDFLMKMEHRQNSFGYENGRLASETFLDKMNEKNESFNDIYELQLLRQQISNLSLIHI